MRYELKATYRVNGETVTAEGACDARDDAEAEQIRLAWLAGLEAKAVDSIRPDAVKEPYVLVSSEKKAAPAPEPKAG